MAASVGARAMRSPTVRLLTLLPVLAIAAPGGHGSADTAHSSMATQSPTSSNGSSVSNVTTSLRRVASTTVQASTTTAALAPTAAPAATTASAAAAATTTTTTAAPRTSSLAARAATTAAAVATTVAPVAGPALPATTTSTRPVQWLSLIGRAYYINLPSIDNWSTYGKLKTRWTKLRIRGSPHVGADSLEVDLHDWTFSESNGETSTAQNLKRIEWGIAAGCSSSVAPSHNEMSIDLVGTPFRYDPPTMEAQGSHAHGNVFCSHDGQQCNASCGGWCGYCGLGEPGTVATARLEVVDRERYDAALLSLMDFAREALRTSTRTTTTVTTTETQTTTSSTMTSTRAAPALFLGRSSRGPGFFGLMVIALVAAGIGLALGFVLRKDAFSRCRGKELYAHFEGEPSVPAQVFGEKQPPNSPK